MQRFDTNNTVIVVLSMRKLFFFNRRMKLIRRISLLNSNKIPLTFMCFSSIRLTRKKRLFMFASANPVAEVWYKRRFYS